MDLLAVGHINSRKEEGNWVYYKANIVETNKATQEEDISTKKENHAMIIKSSQRGGDAGVCPLMKSIAERSLGNVSCGRELLHERKDAGNPSRMESISASFFQRRNGFNVNRTKKFEKGLTAEERP